MYYEALEFIAIVCFPVNKNAQIKFQLLNDEIFIIFKFVTYLIHTVWDSFILGSCDFEAEDLCGYTLHPKTGGWEWLTSSAIDKPYPLPSSDHSEQTNTGK